MVVEAGGQLESFQVEVEGVMAVAIEGQNGNQGMDHLGTVEEDLDLDFLSHASQRKTGTD